MTDVLVIGAGPAGARRRPRRRPGGAHRAGEQRGIRRDGRQRRAGSGADADRKTAKILGCNVVGEGAVEVAQVAAIAMSAGLRVDQLMRIPLAFATYTGNLAYAAASAARQLDLEVREERFGTTSSVRARLAILVALLSTLLFNGIANAQPAPANNDSFKDPTARVFELVLPSEPLFGDWGGLRSKLDESGITPRLILVTDLAGNPSGGRSHGATAPSSIELSLFFDLQKISGLKGGSVFASFSHRWGDSLSAKNIGNTFSTQQIFGFQTYRVIDVSYQQKLFDDRLEVRLGRFAAMDDFLVSPYNFGFMQNAFCGNPFGILLNAPGMSAYYGTWAALGKVKPTKRSYVMTGVYNGDPRIRENKYHGVNLSLNGPLFSISEAGYQINGLPGASQRLGNYKLGVWYDRATLTDFESGAEKRGSWGFYGLLDQVLVPFGSPDSNRGLGIFGSVTVAPDSRIQQLPWFVTAGVSARGMFDARPRDAVSLGVASGHFSEELKRARRNGESPSPAGAVPDHETIIELTYRADLRNGALFIQPDLQFIHRLGGISHFKNALVLGAQFGITF